jgi:hypothetical protein
MLGGVVRLIRNGRDGTDATDATDAGNKALVCCPGFSRSGLAAMRALLAFAVGVLTHFADHWSAPSQAGVDNQTTGPSVLYKSITIRSPFDNKLINII